MSCQRILNSCSFGDVGKRNCMLAQNWSGAQTIARVPMITDPSTKSGRKTISERITLAEEGPRESKQPRTIERPALFLPSQGRTRRGNSFNPVVGGTSTLYTQYEFMGHTRLRPWDTLDTLVCGHGTPLDSLVAAAQRKKIRTLAGARARLDRYDAANLRYWVTTIETFAKRTRSGGRVQHLSLAICSHSDRGVAWPAAPASPPASHR